jgi:hypothetical protein
MKYMLLIYSDPTTAPNDPAEYEKMHAEYLTFTQELIDSRELVAGDALEGTDTATTVRVRGAKTTNVDGPFAETKEVLGGFYIVDVRDLDRALELAARIPHARVGSVEVRPVADMSMPRT